MPMPTGVKTVNVTWGKGISALGLGVAGSLTLTVNMGGSPYIVWSATGDPFLPMAESVVGTTTDPSSIALPVTDQNGWVDAEGNAYKGWSYTARIKYQRGSDAVEFTRTFQLVTGQTDVDLDALPGVGVGEPITAVVPAVTSVNGQTGAVVIVPGTGGGSSTPGATGKSAYEVAVANGFVGTAVQWLASLVGPKGDQGFAGATGQTGLDGKSAYQLARDGGYGGTQTQWLATLAGPAGATGPAGPTGAAGKDGAAGATGATGPAGATGATGAAAQILVLPAGTTTVPAGTAANTIVFTKAA